MLAVDLGVGLYEELDLLSSLAVAPENGKEGRI